MDKLGDYSEPYSQKQSYYTTIFFSAPLLFHRNFIAILHVQLYNSYSLLLMYVS